MKRLIKEGECACQYLGDDAAVGEYEVDSCIGLSRQLVASETAAYEVQDIALSRMPQCKQNNDE